MACDGHQLSRMGLIPIFDRIILYVHNLWWSPEPWTIVSDVRSPYLFGCISKRSELLDQLSLFWWSKWSHKSTCTEVCCNLSGEVVPQEIEAKALQQEMQGNLPVHPEDSRN